MQLTFSRNTGTASTTTVDDLGRASIMYVRARQAWCMMSKLCSICSRDMSTGTTCLIGNPASVSSLPITSSCNNTPHGYTTDVRSGVESYPYPVKEGQRYINLNPGCLFVRRISPLTALLLSLLPDENGKSAYATSPCQFQFDFIKKLLFRS